MKVILIAGSAGSGKTYLGKQIVMQAKFNNLRAIQTEFSKYIKLYAYEIMGYDGNRENKPRKFLQDMGSFIRHDLGDEDFFIRRILEDLRVYESYFDIVVISDVRLIKELESMKESKYNTTTILVKNDLKNNNLTFEEQNHQTEHEFKKYNKYDYIIENKNETEINEYAINIMKKIIDKEGGR